MTPEKESNEIKGEYLMKRNFCVKLYLPPPPLAGSSQIEDNAYCAIRAFEIEQMTYMFSSCEVCKERRLECKGTGNTCTRFRRGKKVPKVWSDKKQYGPV